MNPNEEIILNSEYIDKNFDQQQQNTIENQTSGESEIKGNYQKICSFFSVIFQPIFVPVYILLILFFSSNIYSLLPLRFRLSIIGTVFVTSVLIPGAGIFILKIFKIIESISLKKREERLFPFLIGIFGYIITFFTLSRIFPLKLLLSFMIAAAIASCIAVIITCFWKISIHMVGMGGLTAGAVLLYQMGYNDNLLIPIFAIIFSGIVGSSRLYLGRHNISQVAAGYLVGMVSVWLVLSFN